MAKPSKVNKTSNIQIQDSPKLQTLNSISYNFTISLTIFYCIY